jgi:prepilin-type N-terminal cleavage/methylation domain-containing protein
MKRGDRKGFTFVEILTVMALMAVLVAIAWGRFNRSHDKALEAVMISDLRNLMTAQELYYRIAQTYAPNISLVNIEPSPRSSIHITESTPMGWSGWNEITNATKHCEVYIGNATPTQGIATESSRIFCATF